MSSSKKTGIIFFIPVFILIFGSSNDKNEGFKEKK